MSLASARAGWVASAAVLLFVAALQIHRLDDQDAWWHLASGRLIAASGTVTATDPFSYTAAGAPWVNRQWLFDLGAYGAWWLAGPAGASLAAGVLFLAAFAAVYVLARRRLPAWAAAGLVFLGASAAVERFAVRPEAVTYCFLAIYLLVLDGPLTWPRLGALVLLQVVWANSHALSVLGLLVLGCELASAAAAAWLPLPAGWRVASRREPRALARLGVAFVAAACAEAVTPFGPAGALYPLYLLSIIGGGDVTSQAIIEHRPPVLGDLAGPAALGFVALIVLAIVAAVVSWRRWRVSHLLVAGACVALALMARRNVGLLGIGVAPLVASGLGPRLAAAGRRLEVALGLALTVVLLALTARVVTGRYYIDARLTRTFGLGESHLLFPGRAVDFLDANAADARLFNADALGGYLIWRRYPPEQVFIDGRLQVYPPAVFREYMGALENPGTFPALAARHGIQAALLYHPGPGQLELAVAIARLPGWRVAYVDGGAAVLLADGRRDQPVAGIGDPIAPADPPGPTGALERALRATRIPAEDGVAHYQRGRALLNLLGGAGAAAARSDFEAALRLRPDLHAAGLGLGYALQALGDVAGARRAWQQVLAAEPRYAPAAAALRATPSP